MNTIEDILKEFDRRSEAGNYLDEEHRPQIEGSDSLLEDEANPWNELDKDKVRTFIEQALIEREKEAKLERTKEILEILPEKALCRCGEGCFECYYDSSLSQIKELLTKTT